ncbi:ABC transporter ATP-binding protein [Bacillus sp. FJAT-29790]|uniref:ABC transporter ATP-binding protein n=1 Tax=Bacillus sp. FJAT-29790 TaxID=1895002 RepID=UPI001C21A274|nr:ABC transporter ATP-binding protein [Bacillus sp. FJAT-29790]MBU8878280.1 ABC transporter ATP-binding protein [Bacillus sp. FJAT-29790]
MLEIKNLHVNFQTFRGTIEALKNINLSVEEKEIVGIVGESGSGKSITALSILGLLENNAQISDGEISYRGKNLLTLSKKEFQKIRGKKIAMVFQEPMTALHPTMKVGQQLSEVIRRHRKVSKKESVQLMINALKDVHIHNSEHVAKQYPFELSGGMRQRIVIALAMAAPPDLLIADEPTTALDVTIQHEILQLMKELNNKKGTSILFITHDLGVVSQICDRTVVMYAGEVIESGKTKEVLFSPQHPYTKALIEALPDGKDAYEPLRAIHGEVPNLMERPIGCAFASRCQYVMDICRSKQPELTYWQNQRDVACWLERD